MAPSPGMTSLATPITFRSGATARNRLALAPLTNQQSHADGTLSDDELRHRSEQLIRNYDPCISCATHFLDLTVDRT